MAFSSRKWNYDVFLSFRGPDTRNTLTGHLHRALVDKGINVFIDNELQRGEEITSQLLTVIEESRISIVVLSEKYASSSFCLDELVKILECRESKGQTVIPIFYHVDPADVEEQKGFFGREFSKIHMDFNYWKFVPAIAVKFFKLEKMQIEGGRRDIDRMQNWRLALTKVATLSGYHLKKGDHEANIIQDIVKKVSRRLNYIPMHVAEYPVGLASRMEYILQKLNVESDDICMVGLYGMGGIGKTTTAKALYNDILAGQFNFDGCCFLSNVRENSNKYGLAHLQEHLLNEILGAQIHLMQNVDKGMELIKQRLGRKKVLIAIDDVDDIEQLKKLVGEKKWFGGGSIIIMTTRDRRLLKLHGVTTAYEVEKLENDEAIELFSWYSFKKARPKEKYMKLSSCMIEYAQGLPLALKILGSDLCDCNIGVWEEKLDILKQCPDDDNKITQVLKISYDSLKSEEKNIFLDIAFFFKGKEKGEVTKFLRESGVKAPLASVERLIEKCLINVELIKGRIEMHDLLEEMAIQIGHRNSSRLRIRKIQEMCFEDKNSGEVEGIMLDFGGEEELDLNLLEFTKLRILVIRNGRFKEVPKIPNNIKWLEWPHCCFPSISFDFLPDQLVTLEMPKSSIVHLRRPLFGWKEKKFMNLTRMDFSHCKFLREIVDMQVIPNLEELNLKWCENLKVVNQSIRKLKKLKVLNLCECRSLTSLPNLEENDSLEWVSIEYCSELEDLPKLPTTSTYLNMSYSGIMEIPLFVENLINLQTLSASSCENLVRVSNAIYKLPKLIDFDLCDCPNLSKLPESESCIFSLTHIDLSENKFVFLPTNIFRFSHMVLLNLSYCEWLVEIPQLPHTLRFLHARNCKSLVRFSQFQFHDFVGDFRCCYKLAENEIESWRQMVEKVSLKGMKDYPLGRKYIVVLPENEIPKWFSYAFECDGNNDLSFKFSSALSIHNLIAIVFCTVFQVYLNVEIEISTNDDFTIATGNIYSWFTTTESDHMCLYWFSDFNLPKFSQAQEICFKLHGKDKRAVLKRIGVHFIYKNQI